MRQKRIVIEPEPKDWQLQPASVDLTLGSDFLSPYENGHVRHKEYYTILPGECILATTVERIEVPDDLVARVEGKSSWGRKFIIVHATAGYIDPGFRGNITLELTNLSRTLVSLPVGSPIIQVSFQWVDQPVIRPYGTPALGSHYQDQDGVTGSVLPWS
jgi:dCTP deaminase